MKPFRCIRRNLYNRIRSIKTIAKAIDANDDDEPTFCYFWDRLRDLEEMSIVDVDYINYHINPNTRRVDRIANVFLAAILYHSTAPQGVKSSGLYTSKWLDQLYREADRLVPSLKK